MVSQPSERLSWPPCPIACKPHQSSHAQCPRGGCLVGWPHKPWTSGVGPPQSLFHPHLLCYLDSSVHPWMAPSPGSGFISTVTLEKHCVINQIILKCPRLLIFLAVPIAI